eukprot:scaffold129908_cov79-Attheya_sp.AAC.4
MLTSAKTASPRIVPLLKSAYSWHNNANLKTTHPTCEATTQLPPARERQIQLQHIELSPASDSRSGHDNLT